MVGIFGQRPASSRRALSPDAPAVHDPPPPDRDSSTDGPLYGPESSTAATRTTTAHFFSLPLWRRRASPAFSTAAASPSISRLSADDIGVLRPHPSPAVLLRDKDLPPTPSSHGLSRTAQRDVQPHAPAPEEGLPMAGSSSSASLLRGPSLHAESSSQPTMALVRATLGVGLPHVISSASSSSSDLHNFPLKPPPIPDPPSQNSHSVVRRVKSFRRDAEHRVDPKARETRRNRGLSLGPVQFASLEKGKEKQWEPTFETLPSLPKPISRKSSFWSRKRNDSQAVSPPHIPDADAGPSLPSLQPVSPFYVDTIIPPPPEPPEATTALHLQRRHSDKSRLSASNAEQLRTFRSDVPASFLSPTRNLLKRPQTADTATSSRITSLYPDLPQVIRSSPPQSPASRFKTGEQIVEGKTSPSVLPATRHRSQTNPPLLHRLSVNMFGSPSPPSSTSAPSIVTTSVGDIVTASPTSSLASSRPSLSKEIPQPRPDEEKPEVYVHRLLESVSKAEVATVLASKYVLRSCVAL